MKRIAISPRKDYKEKIEALGFNFDDNYWLENAYYEFKEKEIDEIETATNECFNMFIEATEHVIKNDLWDKLCIPRSMVPAIVKSWEDDDLSIYGRFDFAMVGGIPKMLEFNADTPTSLLEAAVIQWHWKEEMLKGRDQLHNSLQFLSKKLQDSHELN